MGLSPAFLGCWVHTGHTLAPPHAPAQPCCGRLAPLRSPTASHTQAASQESLQRASHRPALSPGGRPHPCSRAFRAGPPSLAPSPATQAGAPLHAQTTAPAPVPSPLLAAGFTHHRAARRCSLCTGTVACLGLCGRPRASGREPQGPRRPGLWANLDLFLPLSFRCTRRRSRFLRS